MCLYAPVPPFLFLSSFLKHLLIDEKLIWVDVDKINTAIVHVCVCSSSESAGEIAAHACLLSLFNKDKSIDFTIPALTRLEPGLVRVERSAGGQRPAG